MNSITSNSLPVPVSLPKVAEILDISKRGVYRLISTGELPRPIKIGGCSKIFIHQVQAYLSRLEEEQKGK